MQRRTMHHRTHLFRRIEAPSPDSSKNAVAPHNIASHRNTARTWAAPNSRRISNDTSKPSTQRFSNRTSDSSRHGPQNHVLSLKGDHEDSKGHSKSPSKDQNSPKNDNNPKNQTKGWSSAASSDATGSKLGNTSTNFNSTANLTSSNNSSSTNDSQATLRDQSQPTTGVLVPQSTPAISSSMPSSLQTQTETSSSDTYHKPSKAAICGIVFGLLTGILLLASIAFYSKWSKKNPHRRRQHYHTRNHSTTDSNRAVRDRSSFGTQFGAHDPFAGPPSTMMRTIPMKRSADCFPRGDLLGGFGIRRASHLGRPDIRPQISAPIMEPPSPLIQRSLSNHSTGVPVSCMSAVVRRMSSTIQNSTTRNGHSKRESWTRDPYHQRGSILSVRNPDIEEDRITNDDADDDDQKRRNVRFPSPSPNYLRPPPQAYYQSHPIGSTLEAEESDAREPPEKRFRYSQDEVPDTRRSPWGMAGRQHLSPPSSSSPPEQTQVALEEGEAVFSGPEIIMRTQAEIDGHLSCLSRSTHYSQDSEERLEVESLTDPAVRSVTPNSLVFVSFGAGRHSRYSERS